MEPEFRKQLGELGARFAEEDRFRIEKQLEPARAGVREVERMLAAPRFDMAALVPPRTVMHDMSDLMAQNTAREFFKRLKKMIQEFEASLDQSHDVGVRLVSFGQTLSFSLTSLGYCNPSLIVFHGTMPDGSPVQLIQHVTQISILLMRADRTNADTPKQPIGFHSEGATSPDPAVCPDAIP